MKHAIQPGDTVAYSARFLRSIGCQTGSMPFARGRVEAVRHYAGVTLANVTWNDSGMPCGVHVSNLVRTADMGLECVE